MASKKKQPTEGGLPASDTHVFTKKELDVPVPTAGERMVEGAKNEKGKEDIEKISIDEDKIDEQITEIYENDDGSMPDMKHFEKRKRRRLLAASALAAACIFLAGVVGVGFFVLPTSSGFADEDVTLSVTGNTEVTAGEETNYRILYRNAERAGLNNAVLQVRYPEGFVLANASVPPRNEGRDEWEIGSLPPGASGYIDIVGRLYGQVGKEQSFRAFLNFIPDNFNSEFQKVATLTAAVSAAPVEMAVDGPDAVVAGGDVRITVRLAPTGGAEIENLAVEVDGGGVFAIAPKASTKPDQFFPNRWSIPLLFESHEITVVGLAAPTSTAASGAVTVRLLGWKDKERATAPYVYQAVTHTLALLHTDLAANLVINASAGDFAVQPGEPLNGSVILRNAGETPLRQVSARMILDAPSANRQSILKWSALEDAKNGAVAGEQLNAERRRGSITWDRRHISDLRQLDPKEEIVIDFALPVKSADDADLTDFPNGAIEATVEVQYELDGKKETFSTELLRLTVNSDTALEARHAMSGDARERHLVSWVVSNSFHELEALRLEADLYGDIAVNRESMKISAGEVVYDEKTKRITWTIPRMPTSVDVLAFEFEIIQQGVNPTQTQLSSKVRFEATDTITGQVIRKVGDEILLR